MDAAKADAGGDELIALTGSPAAIGDLIASLDGRGRRLDGCFLVRDQVRRSLGNDGDTIENRGSAKANDGASDGTTLTEAKAREAEASAASGKALAAGRSSGPATAAVPTTVTIVVRIVEVGPADPVAPSAAATDQPADPSAPSAETGQAAQGAGDQGRTWRPGGGARSGPVAAAAAGRPDDPLPPRRSAGR